MKVNLNQIIIDAVIANVADVEQKQVRKKVTHYTNEGFRIDNYEMMGGKIAVNLVHLNGQQISVSGDSRFYIL